jgi:intracellular protein transport protein USO1
MEFLNQTYFALRGPAETAQNPQDTVSRLADRLAQSTQLEDRRAALFALRGLSRDYRAQVGASALDSLLLVIDGDALVDQEVAKAVLQTLNTLCEVDGGQESSADQREAALRNTDKVLQDPLHTRKLFGLLNSASFYTRYGTLQLLNTLVTNRHSVVQNHFLNAPENSQTVTAVLEEKRDILRTGLFSHLEYLWGKLNPHDRGITAVPSSYCAKH